MIKFYVHSIFSPGFNWSLFNIFSEPDLQFNGCYMHASDLTRILEFYFICMHHLLPYWYPMKQRTGTGHASVEHEGVAASVDGDAGCTAANRGSV
jgi:hypothetical protein